MRCGCDGTEQSGARLASGVAVLRGSHKFECGQETPCKSEKRKIPFLPPSPSYLVRTEAQNLGTRAGTSHFLSAHARASALGTGFKFRGPNPSLLPRLVGLLGYTQCISRFQLLLHPKSIS